MRNFWRGNGCAFNADAGAMKLLMALLSLALAVGAQSLDAIKKEPDLEKRSERATRPPTTRSRTARALPANGGSMEELQKQMRADRGRGGAFAAGPARYRQAPLQTDEILQARGTAHGRDAALARPTDPRRWRSITVRRRAGARQAAGDARRVSARRDEREVRRICCDICTDSADARERGGTARLSNRR